MLAAIMFDNDWKSGWFEANTTLKFATYLHELPGASRYFSGNRTHAASLPIVLSSRRPRRG
jgi:hypothetical protein